MKRLTFFAALGALVATPVLADGWAGSAELGFSNTSGNSKDRTLNVRLDMDYSHDQWRHNVFGDVYVAAADGSRTAERYALGYKPNYFLTDVDYVFGMLRFDKDKFAGINERYTQVVGYGRQLINTPETYLEAEIGAGARQTRYGEFFVNGVDRNAGLDKNEALLYLAGRFTHRVTDTTRFIQNLRVEHGKDNTYTESVTGLQFRVTDAVSARLTHTVRHNSDLRGDRGKRTDHITGVNMVYSF